MDISSKDDNFSANKHNYRTRSKSASRYTTNEKYSTLLTIPPLTRSALSDSNININSATSMKKIHMNKLSPICKSHQIAGKEENVLSQDKNAYFSDGSYDTIKKNTMQDTTLYACEKIISNNSILKSKSLDIKKNIPGDTFLEYLSDDFDRSNMAVCNTIVDVKQADLPSMSNDCEFFDTAQYDEFRECNLISSTKCDISIRF